jgi:Na+(H+)/acetate symporter ActP
MKNNDLQSKTIKQLNSNLSALQAITIALVVVLTLLMLISIYGYVTKENKSTFIATFALAIALSAALPIQFISMKKIKTELKLRENTNE